jgi:predicted cupin superfamily sugar epimerase
MLRDGFGVCARAPCRAGWSLRLHAGVTRRRRVAELASACRASRRWCGLRMCGRRRVLSRMPLAGTCEIRTSSPRRTSCQVGCRIRFGRGGRCLGAAVCVTQAAPVRLHRIRNDQLYHRYLGDAFDVLLLYPDGTHRVEVMGSRIASGQRLRVLIPGGTFHTARLVGAGTWFLGASTEWPGVIPADVEPGDPAALARSFPDAADLICGTHERPAAVADHGIKGDSDPPAVTCSIR